MRRYPGGDPLWDGFFVDHSPQFLVVILNRWVNHLATESTEHTEKDRKRA